MAYFLTEEELPFMKLKGHRYVEYDGIKVNRTGGTFAGIMVKMGKMYAT